MFCFSYAGLVFVFLYVSFHETFQINSEDNLKLSYASSLRTIMSSDGEEEQPISTTPIDRDMVLEGLISFLQNVQQPTTSRSRSTSSAPAPPASSRSSLSSTVPSTSSRSSLSSTVPSSRPSASASVNSFFEGGSSGFASFNESTLPPKRKRASVEEAQQEVSQRRDKSKPPAAPKKAEVCVHSFLLHLIKLLPAARAYSI